MDTLHTSWIEAVESNLQGSDDTLIDLVAQWANTSPADVLISEGLDGASVHDGRRWLDADGIARFVAWVEVL